MLATLSRSSPELLRLELEPCWLARLPTEPALSCLSSPGPWTPAVGWSLIRPASAPDCRSWSIVSRSSASSESFRSAVRVIWEYMLSY